MPRTAKIWFVSLFLQFFVNQFVISQNSAEAGVLAAETETAADQNGASGADQKEAFTRYSESYMKAIRLEKAMAVPDSAFIAVCYQKAGNLMKQGMQLKKAVDFFKLSTDFLYPFSEEYTASAVSIAGAYQLAYENGEYIAPPSVDKKIQGKGFFSISEVLSRDGNSVAVRIRGGKMDGVQNGAAISVLSSYIVDTERGNEFLGSGTITQLDDFYSHALVTLADTSDLEKRIIPGDHVESSVFMLKDKDSEMLHKLALYNIRLVDNWNQALFFPWQLLQNDDPDLQRIIYNALTFCVREMAEFTTDFTEVYDSGVYSGMNCTQAMEVTEACDVDEFFNFINTFPARYLGLEWKISEIHATWIINSTVRGNPYPDFVKWLGPKKENGTLSDFILSRPGYFANQRISEYYDAFMNTAQQGTGDSAFQLIDLLLAISETVENDSLQSVFHEAKANLLVASGKPQDAVEEFSRSILLDHENYNSIYFRAAQYGELGDYDKAIEDCRTLTVNLPHFAGGWGGMGWYLILQGKLFDAQKACLKAFELDSLTTSWTVNLGHTFLFFGDNESAHQYYSRYMKMLGTAKEFEEGLMADFDIFLKNEWQTENVSRAKAHLKSEFDLHYRNYLLADEQFNKGIEEKDKANYKGLIEKMKLALSYELSADSARSLKIHNAYTWMGYGYQYLANFDSASYYYHLGLQIAENTLKSDKDILNDLELISWMYKTAGNSIKANEYNVGYQAQLQKNEELSQKKSLYLIAAGIDHYSDFSFKSASSDALNFASAVQSLSKLGYDTVQVVVLQNDSADRENILKEFGKIVSLSNPYDIFVFYFAGFCGSNTDNYYLATSGLDTLQNDYRKNTISAFSLHTMLSSVPARKQWLVFDAPAQGFVNSLLSIQLNKNASTGIQEKSLFILYPSEARIERAAMDQGLLTHTIIEGMRGKAENSASPDGVVTVKELDSYVFQTMSNPSWYLNFSSYSSGRDFPLAFLENYETRSTLGPAPVSPSMRGASLIESEASQETAANTNHTDYALIFAADNYDEWQDLNNPRFDGETLATILQRDYGFKVELVPDATRETILDKILSYRNRNYNPNDQLFIFFAGHGLYDEENMQEGYIVAKDSKHNDRFKDTYVSFSFLRDQIDLGNCQHVLLVLDVCYGGTFGNRIKPILRGDVGMYQVSSTSEIRDKQKNIKSRHYITSGNKEYVSDGTPGSHSPFASFFIGGLIQCATDNMQHVTYSQLVAFIDQIKTSTPTFSEFGSSESGANFIFEVNTKQKNSSLGEMNLTKPKLNSP